MSDASTFKRIIYASRATGLTGAEVRRDHDDILASSQRNNGMDGVSGLLLSKSGRYLQLLEGPPESVDVTFDRIRRDPRHADVIVLDESAEAERVFADWTMAGLPGEHPADAVARLQLLLRNAPNEVGRLFQAQS